MAAIFLDHPPLNLIGLSERKYIGHDVLIFLNIVSVRIIPCTNSEIVCSVDHLSQPSLIENDWPYKESLKHLMIPPLCLGKRPVSKIPHTLLLPFIKILPPLPG